MGKKTKIDWCDASWNPVTGCFHGCEYCYARRIAERFGGSISDRNLHELNELEHFNDGKADCYPWGFAPTFHRYKLNEPQHWKKPRNIFVCSMADLFGEWVPDAWIEEVFKACEEAPQHRYLFLTKNPSRYKELLIDGDLPRFDNMWYGTTTPTKKTNFFYTRGYNTFASIEPIQEPFTDMDDSLMPDTRNKWLIVGAETGNRKSKKNPEKSWITDIIRFADETHTPLFMKESLRSIMGDDFRQEYPWEV